MAFEIGHGDEQVERMAFGQQRRPAIGRGHGVERIEQHGGEDLPAKGRFEPARADEAR